MSEMNIRRIAEFLSPFKGQIGLILVLVTVSALLGIVPPIALRSIQVQQNYDLRKLRSWLETLVLVGNA